MQFSIEVILNWNDYYCWNIIDSVTIEAGPSNEASGCGYSSSVCGWRPMWEIEACVPSDEMTDSVCGQCIRRNCEIRLKKYLAIVANYSILEVLEATTFTFLLEKPTAA